MPSVLRNLLILLVAIVTSARGAVNISSLAAGGQPVAQDLGLAPTILNVRGKVARVQVPPGFEQITIERKVARRGPPWVVFKSQRCSTEGGEIVIKLPRRMPKAALRATGRRVVVLPPPPASARLSQFYPPPKAAPEYDTGYGQIYAMDGIGQTLSLAGDTTTSSSVTEPIAREVVESDIWKLHGDRLYVFNPYRGLQSLDVANPAEPVLLGTLSFPMAGDALYLLDDTRVALLTRREFNFTWNHQPIGNGGSLVICDVGNDKPVAVATLPIPGRIVESRLVGTALYVATTEYLPLTSTPTIRVTGYDLSDPAHPVERNHVILPLALGAYSSPTVQASDAYFMVAQDTNSFGFGLSRIYRSKVSLVDISSPSGEVKLRGSATTAGLVQDKFKLQEREGILTAISNVVSPRHTQLENFSLSNPDAPALLGSLALGANETVRGTRFDGDRVYVVTFLQIDPLWIVDNSKPSAPAIVGHLEVPGFSTYLEPLGDRLVTIGLVSNRVTVSLFDVGNPAAPKVLSQLPVTETFSWSEATWNEKAFSVNPGAGLIMLPVNSGWSVSGQTGAVQLVDLEREHLKVRGRIERSFVPRRSAFHRGTIVAIGDAKLLTADTTDRDHPAVLAEVDLAWRTDFAWPVGNYLLQVGADIDGANPVITVSPKSDPDAGLTTVELGPERVMTADLRDGYLYVVQNPASAGPFTNAAVIGQTPPAAYRLSIFNVTSLPQIVPLGQVSVPAKGNVSVSVRIVWPQAGTAVLAATERTWGYGGYDFILPPRATLITTQDFVTTTFSTSLTTSSLSASSLGMVYWMPSTTVMNLVACDVTNPATPAVLGETIVPAGWGNFSEVLAEAGKVFVSRQNGWGYLTIHMVADSEGLFRDLNAAGRYFLHVVDYTNPSSPVSREPISAPGTLKGLTRGGTVVYTEGWQYDETGIGLAGTNALHASVYDGQKLELAAEHPYPSPGRALTLGDRIFTFYNKATPETEGKLANYTALLELQPELHFVQQDEIRFGGYGERAVDGVLFTTSVDLYGTVIRALDFSIPTDLRNLGSLGAPWLEHGLQHLTGDREDGFWLPAADYGLLNLGVPSP